MPAVFLFHFFVIKQRWFDFINVMHHNEKTVGTRFLELLRPIERGLEVYCRRMIWNSADRR